LLEYAARSWFYHCELQHGGETSREVSFLQNGRVKDDWLLVHDPESPWEPAFVRHKYKVKVPGSAMYHVSLFGLSVVASSFLASGADANVQDGEYGSAVQAAAARGHTETVQLLRSLVALQTTTNSKLRKWGVVGVW
jgi:ankyrin repeat protein